MTPIKTIEDLDALYGAPGPAATQKVARRVTPEFRIWLARSRFCILSTVGPEGTDASPRGDDGAVVRELDAGTLALPDWRGNNRIDSLRNIVRDPRVSLMFLCRGPIMWCGSMAGRLSPAMTICVGLLKKTDAIPGQ